MKLHPAIKKAKLIFKQHGLETHCSGTLSLHVICREYHPRPCIVDLKFSNMEDIAKIDVCEFSEGHPMWPAAMALHGHKFNF
jgi:hypothetical protein